MSRRDVRPLIYAGLDLVFAITYAGVISSTLPNRHVSGALHVWSVPVLMFAMAIGMFGVLVPRARRIGWWAAVIAGSCLLLSTILLIVRVLVSAAFLAGVYGAFGKGAAMTALVGVALVVELVALLPLVQLKFLMSRAGKRAFAPA